MWPPEVVELVRVRATWWNSTLHGFGHWERVADNVGALAAETGGADLEVALLFALFHDSMRENDGFDPEHGRRGGALARELLEGLASARLDLLAAACDGHADGFVSLDPTVGVCWDADRLRVPPGGIEPGAKPMSTA